MIIVVYGVNGVGKDEIFKKISNLDSRFIVVSYSRLLMFHLGLIANYDLSTKLDDDIYRKLEVIKEEKIRELENTLCFNTLLKLSKSGKIIICLSHLIISRFIDNKYYYSISTNQGWIKKIASGLILIKANPDNILNWRKNNQRMRSEHLFEINLEQKNTVIQWKKIVISANIPNIIIENEHDKLDKVVEKVLNFIKKIKK